MIDHSGIKKEGVHCALAQPWSRVQMDAYSQRGLVCSMSGWMEITLRIL